LVAHESFVLERVQSVLLVGESLFLLSPALLQLAALHLLVFEQLFERLFQLLELFALRKLLRQNTARDNATPQRAARQ